MSQRKREIPTLKYPIIETHFHLDMLKSMSREDIVAKTHLHNIEKMITISTSPRNLDEVIHIAETFSHIY
jgi:TatD DNase family protein